MYRPYGQGEEGQKKEWRISATSDDIERIDEGMKRLEEELRIAENDFAYMGQSLDPQEQAEAMAGVNEMAQAIDYAVDLTTQILMYPYPVTEERQVQQIEDMVRDLKAAFQAANDAINEASRIIERGGDKERLPYIRLQIIKSIMNTLILRLNYHDVLTVEPGGPYGQMGPEALQEAINQIRTALAYIESLPQGQEVEYLIEGTEDTRDKAGWVGIREIVNQIVGWIIKRTGWSGGVQEAIEIPEVIDQEKAIQMLQSGTWKLEQIAYDTGAARTRDELREQTGSGFGLPHSPEWAIDFMKERVREIADGLRSAGYLI